MVETRFMIEDHNLIIRFLCLCNMGCDLVGSYGGVML